MRAADQHREAVISPSAAVTRAGDARQHHVVRGVRCEVRPGIVRGGRGRIGAGRRGNPRAALRAQRSRRPRKLRNRKALDAVGVVARDGAGDTCSRGRGNAPEYLHRHIAIRCPRDRGESRHGVAVVRTRHRARGVAPAGPRHDEIAARDRAGEIQRLAKRSRRPHRARGGRGGLPRDECDLCPRGRGPQQHEHERK